MSTNGPIKIVFDVYHLYHLPQFDPVIDLLKSDDKFEIFLSTSCRIKPEEKVLTEKMANTSLSLPVREFIKESDIKLMTKLIHKFYQK